MRFEEVLELRRTPEEALNFIGDFRNLLLWDPNCKAARMTQGDGLAVGTRFHIVVRFAGRDIPMDYEVREYQPGRRIVLAGRSDKARALDSISAEPRTNGCRVTYQAEISVDGAGRLMDTAMKLLFAPTVRRGMANLRRLLGN
ncbi:MAG: SRPBCC family protein [Nevskiales bacterium]